MMKLGTLSVPNLPAVRPDISGQLDDLRISVVIVVVDDVDV